MGVSAELQELADRLSFDDFSDKLMEFYLTKKYNGEELQEAQEYALNKKRFK